MPTVPPTFISFDSDDEFFHHPAVVADVSDNLSGPTPDPDLDDGHLVPVVTGDGVGAVTSPDSFAEQVSARSMSLKPRLDLSDLSLHSPSSILGTPFDVSPRFEYPFPPSSTSAESDAPWTSLNVITSPFMTYSSAFLPTLPPSLPISRPEARCHSPTHSKLQPRDVPIPPTLVKKRWSNTISAVFSQSSRPPHPRKRSHSSASLKIAADGPDEPISASPRETWVQEGGNAQSEYGDAKPSRRSSLSRGTRRRLGKEPEVVHITLSGPRQRDVRPLTTEILEQGNDTPVSDIVTVHSPRPYPQISPSSMHDSGHGETQ